MNNFKFSVEADIDLNKTLDSGQIFRVDQIKKDNWIILQEKNLIEVLQKDKTLYFEGISKDSLIDENALINFFSLSDNLDEIEDITLDYISNWAKDKIKITKKIFYYSKGLRILKQEPFETIISYILSVQSSIALIKKRLDKISSLFLDNKILYKNQEYYLFPGFEELKELKDEEFDNLKLGYRKDWILNFLNFLNSYQELLNLANFNEFEKGRYLKNFKGIGTKVSSCIRLFAYHELSSFPVDVWIERGIKEIYGIKTTNEKLSSLAKDLFGPYAGYFQEYLYRFIRHHWKNSYKSSN